MTGEDTIGVGIVGLGADRGWAATGHLPALRSLDGFEVRASCSRTRVSSRHAARVHGIPAACGDVDELVARDDVDVVLVAVRVPEHRHLVMAAVEAGKPVMCEWPLGRTLEETEELADLTAARGVRGFIGLQARASSPVRTVRRLVRSGRIGDLLSTTLIGAGEQWGPTVDHPNVYLTDVSNGATLLSIAVGHALDGLCSALGEFDEVVGTVATQRGLVEVKGTGRLVPMTAPDQVAICGRLQGGPVASVHYRGGRPVGPRLFWEVVGAKGSVLVRGRSGLMQFGLAEIEVTDGSGRLEPCMPNTPDGDASVPPVAASLRVLWEWIGADLRDETATAPTFEDARRRHRLVDAVARAAATGIRQRVDVADWTGEGAPHTHSGASTGDGHERS